MSSTTRRRFIKTALAGTGAAVTAQAWSACKGTEPVRTATDQVPLGRTGFNVSFLAQGTGFKGFRRASDHTRLGQEDFGRLLRHGMEQGISFMDMADIYGSHPYVREVLKEVPRERYVLLSKIWTRPQGDWLTPSGGAKKEVDRFRKELDEDRIDACLIHCMTKKDWPDLHQRVRDELSELKEKGVVRAVGVSCHNLDALKTASEHPWVDVIFARINNMGGGKYSMDGELDEVVPVLKRARANGKAVVGMKIFGEGRLVEPDQKDASLKYVIENRLVDAMTIGMLKTSEIDDSIERINKVFSS